MMCLEELVADEVQKEFGFDQPSGASEVFCLSESQCPRGNVKMTTTVAAS